ncbi:MAG: dicarboxylate/amino acid:cation symporter [Acidobacteria bacterium]|nr:dicarboxylate/amino acid:cation symporter [Acidobacteriota bacterium]
MPLHTKIFAGLLLGAACGGAANFLSGGGHPALDWVVNNVTEPAGRIFLRLLLLVVIPLVFSSLTLAVRGMADLRRLGRVGSKTLLYTVIVSGISVLIGLTLANIVRPGERIAPQARARLIEQYHGEAEQLSMPTSGARLIENLVPDNPVAAMAKNPPDMMGIMVFAVIFGLGLMLIPERRSEPVAAVLEGVFQAVSKIIDLIMRLAPYGVFALLFTMTARFGFSLLPSLLWFVGVVLAGLALQQFGVYWFILRFLARTNPMQFFSRIKTVMLTAFSTSSSNATLPTALRVAQEKLALPREISSFVLTIGATANQNGTALYEGVTVLFLAQVFGVHLTLAQQGLLLVLTILAGVGTAGVPSGSIPFVMLILQQVNVPMEGIAIVLGIDRILDMCRTVLNVTGDMVAATYISRSEAFAVEAIPVARTND